MARNTSVTLGPHFEAFVERQIDTGRYATASEVLRAGLRMLEDHEKHMEALRDELVSGEQSGTVTDFDFDEFLAEMRRQRGDQT